MVPIRSHHMRPTTLFSMLAPVCFALGCGDPNPSTAATQPFRDAWVVEVDALPIAEGVELSEIIIGGATVDDNFANRGDVIVQYTGEPGTITVEMRRFTMATDEASAQDDYDLLKFWAYAGQSRPKDPKQITNDEGNCALSAAEGGAWQDACAIRVYYDGLTQLARSGADFRVTLPRDYNRKVSITTEDNVADGDYHNRGDICALDAFGSLDIKTGSGITLISFADDMPVEPVCSAADIATCNAANWDATCPCSTINSNTRIESFRGNVVVDVPPSLWAKFTGRLFSAPSDSGADCKVAQSADTFMATSASSIKLTGDVNRPQGAPQGPGYAVTVEVTGCGGVTFTEDPADFVGNGNGEEQTTDARGNVDFCIDCLKGKSCEEWLETCKTPGSCDFAE